MRREKATHPDTANDAHAPRVGDGRGEFGACGDVHAGEEDRVLQKGESARVPRWPVRVPRLSPTLMPKSLVSGVVMVVILRWRCGLTEGRLLRNMRGAA